MRMRKRCRGLFFRQRRFWKQFADLYRCEFILRRFADFFLVSDSEIIDRWLRQNLFNNEINEEYLKNKNKTYTLLANRFIDSYQNKMVRRKIVRFFTGYNLSEPELVPQW